MRSFCDELTYNRSARKRSDMAVQGSYKGEGMPWTTAVEIDIQVHHGFWWVRTFLRTVCAMLDRVKSLFLRGFALCSEEAVEMRTQAMRMWYNLSCMGAWKSSSIHLKYLVLRNASQAGLKPIKMIMQTGEHI